MEYAKYWLSHSTDIMDKLVDVYQRIQISKEDVEKYQNLNFDEILEIIGNHYANESKEKIRLTVYAIAYDKIASIANANNTKKSRFKYWVSKKQIKSLRKAYKQLYNSHKTESTQFYVKIPYNTIYILNAVYDIALKIKLAAEKLNNKKLSEHLAKNYIDLYMAEVARNRNILEIQRASELCENILDGNQRANMIFRG